MHYELGDGTDKGRDFGVIGHLGVEYDVADRGAAVRERDGPRHGGDIDGLGLERRGLGHGLALGIGKAQVLIDQRADFRADFVGDLLIQHSPKPLTLADSTISV